MAKGKGNNKYIKHEGGFIGLPRRVFESSSYRGLSLSARCLLDEFQYLFRKERNGRIGMSLEKVCERLNISYKTAQKAMDELEEKRFIDNTAPANRHGSRAREWRLTYEPYQGKEPTDDFLINEQSD